MPNQHRSLPVLCLVAVAAVALVLGCGPKKPKATEAEESPTYTIRMAQSMMNAGRVGEALELARGAVERDPENPTLHHFYGQLCFGAGRPREAEKEFRRVLEIDPLFTDAHNYLGAVYQELDLHVEAEREYRTALSHPAYPTPERVYLGLGLLFADQGRDEEAIGSLRRAVEINPRFYRAHFELAALLERTGKLAEAAREYEVAEPGFRNYGDFYYRLGFTYFRLGDRTKARRHLSRVRVVAPGSESAAQAEELLAMLD